MTGNSLTRKTTILLSLFAVICMVIIGCSSGSNSSLSGGNWVGLTGSSTSVNYATLTGIITDENGQPLENVFVRILSASMVTDSAITDSTGRYQITLPPGAYTVTVQRNGYASIIEEVVLAESEVKVFSRSTTMVSAPTEPVSANIIGTVLLNATSEVLPNITVALSKDGKALATTTTTTEGKFIFQGWSTGMYVVALSDADKKYVPTTYVIHILNDGKLSPELPELYLSVKTIEAEDVEAFYEKVEGTVYDDFSKAPLQYVKCTINGIGDAVSDLNGKFVFDRKFLPDTYELTFSRNGWTSLTTNFTIRAQEADPTKTEILPASLTYYLSQNPEQDKGAISGRIVDETTGKGIPGLIVRLYRFEYLEGIPDKSASLLEGEVDNTVYRWSFSSAAPSPLISTRTGSGSESINGSFRIEHVEPTDEKTSYVVYVGKNSSTVKAKIEKIPVVIKADDKSEPATCTFYIPDSINVDQIHLWERITIESNTTTYLHNFDLPNYDL